MTPTAAPPQTASALERIARGAGRRDRDGDGLGDALSVLEEAGLMAWNAVAGDIRPTASAELTLVRAIARADSSVGRVFDGHLNAVERLAVHAPAALRERELPLVRAGLLRLGVWGGVPRPDEGEPAWIAAGARAGKPEVLRGVTTFCSGAGHLDRALVLAHDRPGAEDRRPVPVWVDLTDPARLTVDTDWYVSSGLRASASHRVIFHDTPILGRLGGPGAISSQPWFGRDGLRTAASWAGMADRAVDAALDELASRERRGELEALAAGRILAARGTIDAWIERGARAMDTPDASLADTVLHARAGISVSARALLDEAAAACGSHPFATGGDLDRVRRDLQLFLLQHRLEPGLARSGVAALNAITTGGPR